MSQRLPAKIYWRRRLLLLALAIGVVWVVLRLTAGDDGKPTTDPTPTATTGSPTTPTAAAPVDGVVNVSLMSARRACDPEKVRITPTVDSGQLAGGAVKIGLVVSSTDTKPCTLTPSDANLVAVISAGKSAIWDSTVCRESLLADPVSLSPRWASLVTAQWSGRGSGGGCSPTEDYAAPRKYTVQVGTLGGEPGRTTFTLERRPTPKPTGTTPSPKPTSSTSTPTPKPPKTTTRPAD